MAKLTTKISVLDLEPVKELIDLIGKYQDELPVELIEKLKEIQDRMEKHD